MTIETKTPGTIAAAIAAITWAVENPTPPT
jgi:hypothetical protein